MDGVAPFTFTIPEPEEEKQEGLSPLPEFLTDTQSLAKQVFDYWIKTMVTDSVKEVQETDGFDDLPDEMKEHWVEAVQTCVVDPLRKFYEQLRLEAKALEAMAYPKVGDRKPRKKGPSRPVACYVCLRHQVQEPGEVCDGCSR